MGAAHGNFKVPKVNEASTEVEAKTNGTCHNQAEEHANGGTPVSGKRKPSMKWLTKRMTPQKHKDANNNEVEAKPVNGDVPKADEAATEEKPVVEATTPEIQAEKATEQEEEASKEEAKAEPAPDNAEETPQANGDEAAKTEEVAKQQPEAKPEEAEPASQPEESEQPECDALEEAPKTDE